MSSIHEKEEEIIETISIFTTLTTQIHSSGTDTDQQSLMTHPSLDSSTHPTLISIESNVSLVTEVTDQNLQTSYYVTSQVFTSDGQKSPSTYPLDSTNSATFSSLVSMESNTIPINDVRVSLVQSLLPEMDFTSQDQNLQLHQTTSDSDLRQQVTSTVKAELLEQSSTVASILPTIGKYCLVLFNEVCICSTSVVLKLLICSNTAKQIKDDNFHWKIMLQSRK